jgi:RHS repeat-associated protein
MVDGPSPGAVTAQTLVLPDKPGSIKGLADPASVKVFSGQVAYSIPIVMPPGRAGFGPSLALSYSGELGDGPVGVGWSLGSFAIKRTLRYGVPSYTDSDELELIGIAGGGRLYSADGKRYWVEGKGTSVKVDRKGRWFEVTDSNGVRYVMGMSDGAVQEVDGQRAGWFVESIIDVTGLQRIDFSYEHDANEVYLKSIAWGPPLATGGVPGYRLDITLEDRPDHVTSWARGFEVKSQKRMSRLKVSSFGEPLRQYDLSYFAVDKSFRLSRLQRVRVSGFSKTGSTGGPDGGADSWAPSLSLPDVTFTYVQPTLGKSVQVANVEGWVLNDRGTNLLDVDGDGMADLYRMEMGGHVYRKGAGSGFSESRYTVSGADGTDLESTRLMDLDGDARPDLVRIVNDTWRWSKLVPESAGSLNFKWVSQGEWPGTATVPLSGPDIVFADINGDGRTDILRAAADNLLVRFNTKAGLGPVQRMPLIDPYNVNVVPGNSYVRFEDLNGDGLVDVVWLTDSWMKTWLGKGDGTFVPLDRYDYPWGTGAFSDKEVFFADLDRDGILDLIRITVGYVTWFPGLPGGGFDKDFRMVARPTDAAADCVVSVADANGNGSRDIIWSAPTGMWILDLAGEGTAGMIESIDNGLGMSMKVTYKSSAQLAVDDEAAGNVWTNKLPVAVPMPVTTLTTFSDGATPDRQVTFGVRNGVWDGDERRFAGFLVGGRTVAGTSASDLLHEEMGFLAGLGEDRVLRGVQNFSSSENGLGAKFATSSSTWVAMPVAGLQAHPWAKKAAKLSESTSTYDGAKTPILSSSTFEYDGEVRLVREHHHGREDMSGDEKEVARKYASDDTTWVRDRVCEEWLYEGDGTTLVTDVQTFYGDAATVNGLCTVGKGWPRSTKAVRQPGGAHDPDQSSKTIELSRRTYDSYGNPTSIYASGVTRNLSYTPDTAGAYPDALFVTQESVSPSAGKTLAWTAKWDRRLGVVTESSDPNQVSTTVDYDELGRYTGARVGTNPQHIRYVYDWAAPMPRTTTYVYNGDLSSIPSTDPTQNWASAAGWRQSTLIANGAGEDLFSATRLASQQWIVNGWKERDGRGKVVKHGDAFYWTGSDPRLATPPTVAATDPNYFRYQTLKYDALGRLVEQDLPSGATKTVGYTAFAQTVTASELSPVQSVLDGLGRIAHTERKVSGVVESVDAAFDAAGRIRSMSLQDGKAVHEYRYDTLGRMVWARDPDIGTRELRYSDEGFLIRHRNGAGDVLAFTYDHAGRLSGRGTFAAGASSSAAFSDPAANAFTTPAWNSAYNYSYDDRASEVTSCSKAHTAGRLAAVDEPAGAASGAGRVAFCYDELGRQNAMTRSINGGAAKAWILNKQGASGLLLHQEADDGFALYPSYDRAGRLQSLDDNPNAAGDIWHAGATTAPDTLSGFDAAGRVFGETYGNGLVQSYQRDKLGLPSDIQIGKPPAVPIYHVSLPDAGGRTLYGAPSKLVDNVAGGLDHSATYHYDGAARLVNATIGQTPATQWSFRFAYDGLQNMTGRTQTGPNPAGIGILAGYYQYGETINSKAHGPRQLTSIASEDCTQVAVATFDYDRAGRMTTGDKRTLSYDGYDQLLRVDEVGKSPLVQYAYGFDGVRTYAKAGGQNPQYWFTESYSTAPDGSRWHYVSIGDRLVSRLSFSAVSAPFHDPIGLALVARAMTWAGDRAANIYAVTVGLACLSLLGLALIRRQRSPWMTVPATSAAFALLMALGSCAEVESKRKFLEVAPERLYYHQGVAAGPVMTTKLSGAVDEERRYEPFGQVIDAWGGNMSILASYVHQPFNSLNKETDSQTKWSYHGARWMMPQTARWTAPDPAVKGPDPRHMLDPSGLHPYSYVKQSPTLYWDPLGLAEEDAGVQDASPPAGGTNDYDSVEQKHWASPEGARERQGMELDSAIREGHVKWGYEANWAIAYGLLKVGGQETAGSNVRDFVVNHQIDKKYDKTCTDTSSIYKGMIEALGLAIGVADLAFAAREAFGVTEIVERAMSRAELAATRETGLLRGGREGTHFVSDAVNSSATRAQERLALSVRPEVKVQLEVRAGTFSAPSRVAPIQLPKGGILPGGGMERTATGPVPVRILGVDDL